MNRINLAISAIFTCLVFASSGIAQADDFCKEFGSTPSLNSPFAQVPYVFGRITLKGLDPGGKFPKITVTLVDREQTEKRVTVEKIGNYCFKRSSNSSGTLIVEVEGMEAARRSLTSFGAAQQREDFEIYPMQLKRAGAPGTVSARFSHPPNDKTIEYYRKASEAEANKNLKDAVKYLNDIVRVDPIDFIAWAKLGSLYFEQTSYADAEAAFRKSLVLKPGYTPAWIIAGKLRMAQKHYEAAIEVFKHAAQLEPTSARTFQLLGEAYLLSRQGSLGVEALNEALRLDPLGMAECHLQLAHLYQLAGAKQLATREYKAFLAKVPEHPDRKKFEKFIRDNPE